MADDDERRRKDRRDLEFYGKRVMPTASDLFRTNRYPLKNNGIGFSFKRSLEQDRRHQTIDAPASLGEVLTDRRYRRDQEEHEDPAPPIPKPEIERDGDDIWPLVAAVMVLMLLASGGSISRLPAALAF